ncbi:uncharacterized protein CLUP02_03214 [Colletotrichum lupini]|uniref:Uncharacterized protein n=1 Tax=Colletotrichum lupini TaxID=145971 RepID=A0A9Q8SIF8_9PEZI|nr:uncharacterized protein CLUP02_03214 [Colletotrichum lupini]UQC77743.1 hypothetical protein CLUP02_03214 [Colletotrichum lupini]
MPLLLHRRRIDEIVAVNYIDSIIATRSGQGNSTMTRKAYPTRRLAVPQPQPWRDFLPSPPLSAARQTNIVFTQPLLVRLLEDPKFPLSSICGFVLHSPLKPNLTPPLTAKPRIRTPCPRSQSWYLRRAETVEVSQDAPYVYSIAHEVTHQAQNHNYDQSLIAASLSFKLHFFFFFFSPSPHIHILVAVPSVSTNTTSIDASAAPPGPQRNLHLPPRSFVLPRVSTRGSGRLPLPTSSDCRAHDEIYMDLPHICSMQLIREHRAMLGDSCC